MPKIEITLKNKKPEYAYGEALRISCRIKNTSENQLFIVTDKMYKQKTSLDGLQVIIGEIKVTDAMEYFAYRAPHTRKLAAGRSAVREVVVAMPLQESVLGNDGLLHQQEVSLDGAVKVTVALGYGTGEFAPRTPDPYGEFLRWQTMVHSKPVTVNIHAP